jgi:hypothetical protein
VLRVITQVAYKAFRVVPSNRKAVSRINSVNKIFSRLLWIFLTFHLHQMIHAFLRQQSRIDQLQNDHISSIRAAKTIIAGIAVPAVAVRWYRQGNMLTYIQCNPHVNKLNLVRLPPLYGSSGVDPSVQVIDLANGLAALHSINIIHGNLHPVSALSPIVIDSNRRRRI